MDDLSLHDIVSIKTSLHTHAPFAWRKMMVVNSEGKEFEVTFFGEKKNLEIVEEKSDEV